MDQQSFGFKATSVKPKLTIYCDGGSRFNPGRAAIGFLVKNEQGKTIYKEGKTIGIATNNVAEYIGVISCLEWLRQSIGELFKPLDVSVLPAIIFYLDSQLIVNQLKGLYKIKKPRLQVLAMQAKQLEAALPVKIIYRAIPREKNYEADALVNQAFDNEHS